MIYYKIMIALFLFGEPEPVIEHVVSQLVTREECKDLGLRIAELQQARMKKKWPALPVKVGYGCTEAGYGA